jgi:hypothetical protein
MRGKEYAVSIIVAILALLLALLLGRSAHEGQRNIVSAHETSQAVTMDT